MAIFTYSPKQIRSLELALRSKVSKNAANRSRAELNRYVKERFARRKARLSQVDRLLTQARAPIEELLKKDKRFVANAKALRKLATDDFKKSRARRPLRTNLPLDPRLIANSGLKIRVPPYDDAFLIPLGHDAFGHADKNTGSYTLYCFAQPFGAAGLAGVAADFITPESNPRQRVAVLVDYDYAWSDISMLGTAHNDASTNVWIWGFSEGFWVSSSWRFDPQWSDGTGGLEEHGSGGDGSHQSGRESLEVFFPARENSVYRVWVWSDGSCDAGLWSLAHQEQNISVPLMVLGEL